MITIENFGHRDYGRLGNQLFQYSLAKILATYNNCNFYLNPSNHFLNFFDANSLTYSSITKKLNTQEHKESDPYGFQPEIFHKTDINLLGFFQNLSYYRNFLDILNQEILPNINLVNKTLKYLKQKTKYTLDLDESICIHIRRTDYTVLQRTYGFLNIEYYLDIIKNYINKYKHIFIISDDIQKVKNELCGDLLGSNVYLMDDLDVYHDFYIMYLSRINLIANSTFSWWAALLSSLRYSKKIYAPYPWLNSNYVSQSYCESIDLYPSSWYKINTNTFKWNKLFI
jgi:hypothetical protein